MKHQLKNELFPYEFDELLNALRRDMRAQQSLAGCNNEWAEWHQANARMVCRLLEVLNPKVTQPAAIRDVCSALAGAAATSNIVRPRDQPVEDVLVYAAAA